MKQNKYNRVVRSETIDVYDVLAAFDVTCPARQHAIKKLLCAGLRGHKDELKDLTEALQSVERALGIKEDFLQFGEGSNPQDD